MELRFNRNHGKWFVNDVLRAIRRYGLIGRGDRVAVALSGGKDSTLLLYVLRYLQRFSHLRFHLSALHVKAFADDDPAPLRDLCHRLHVEYHETTLDWEPARSNSAIIDEKGWDALKPPPFQAGCGTMAGANHHGVAGHDTPTNRGSQADEGTKPPPGSRQPAEERGGTATGIGPWDKEDGRTTTGCRQTSGSAAGTLARDRPPATPGTGEVPGRPAHQGADQGEEPGPGRAQRTVPAAAGRTICALCSRLKRGAMARLCAEHGITRLAYGHHGTDVAETFLMNLFETKKLGSFRPRIDPGDWKSEGGPAVREGRREPSVAPATNEAAPAAANRAGRRPRVTTDAATAPFPVPGQCPVPDPSADPSPAPALDSAAPNAAPTPRPPLIIRPLVLLDERTVAAVHRHLGLPVTGFRCPYAPLSRRALYKSVLADLERRLGLPGLPRRIVDALAHADPGNLWEDLRKERATGPTTDDGTT